MIRNVWEHRRDWQPDNCNKCAEDLKKTKEYDELKSGIPVPCKKKEDITSLFGDFRKGYDYKSLEKFTLKLEDGKPKRLICYLWYKVVGRALKEPNWATFFHKVQILIRHF